MSFQQKLLIITGLAISIALIVVVRRSVGGTSGDGARTHFTAPIATSLALVAGALIVVGIVSHTLIRHVIQIVPLIMAIILLIRWPAIGVPAAVPLLGFWLLIMGGIWLFLLGLARVFTGTFSPAEIALTIVIGFGCLFGITMAYQQVIAAPLGWRLGTVIVFAALQFAAMWLSVQPSVAMR
jgi:hypothetical protein